MEILLNMSEIINQPKDDCHRKQLETTVWSPRERGAIYKNVFYPSQAHHKWIYWGCVQKQWATDMKLTQKKFPPQRFLWPSPPQLQNVNRPWIQSLAKHNTPNKNKKLSIVLEYVVLSFGNLLFSIVTNVKSWEALLTKGSCNVAMTSWTQTGWPSLKLSFCLYLPNVEVAYIHHGSDIFVCFFKVMLGTNKLAEQIKALATKTDNLNSIPTVIWWKGRTDSPKLFSGLMHTGKWVQKCTINVFFFNVGQQDASVPKTQ